MFQSAYDPKMQAMMAFSQQRQRGLRHRMWNTLRGKSSELADFKQVREDLSVSNQHDIGIQVIAVDEIHGSVGRTSDFDDEFFPMREGSQDRWCGVARAMYSGRDLPPVDLYKVDDEYFVIDGNHRISVMKAIGQEFVEAHVIEIESTEPRCQTQEIPAARFDR